jgi:hypothetical protein
VLLLPLGAWLAARTLYRVSGQVRGSGPSRRSIVTLALTGARRTSPGHNAYQRMQRELAATCSFGSSTGIAGCVRAAGLVITYIRDLGPGLPIRSALAR